MYGLVGGAFAALILFVLIVVREIRIGRVSARRVKSEEGAHGLIIRPGG